MNENTLKYKGNIEHIIGTSSTFAMFLFIHPGLAIILSNIYWGLISIILLINLATYSKNKEVLFLIKAKKSYRQFCILLTLISLFLGVLSFFISIKALGLVFSVFCLIPIIGIKDINDGYIKEWDETNQLIAENSENT